MARYKFHYTKFGPFYRPLIPITLQHKKVKITYLALLDSGADFNLLHLDIAEVLGIDLTKLQTTFFAGIQQGL